MTHFAKIENDIVTQVIVAEQDFINTLEGEWVQTSYNTYGGEHPAGTPLRYNYAGIGFTYDRVKDAFIAPQSFPSWVLDTSTCLWEAPTPYPQDGKDYRWDEESLTWKEIANG